MNIKESISWAIKELQSSESPELDARLLLEHLIDLNKVKQLTYPEQGISEAQFKHFQELIFKRKESVPIAYLVGKKEFWGMEFIVNPSVLIPRPETESMIEIALEFLKDKSSPSILDLGTGSGCIAIALAKEIPMAQIIAVDKSKEALDVAIENADNLLETKNINFLQSNWFSDIPDDKRFDLIISNPPYVASGMQLAKDISYEPNHALFAGEEGIDDIKILLEQAPGYLNKSGAMLCEFSPEQKELVQGQGLKFYNDLSGSTRFFMFFG